MRSLSFLKKFDSIFSESSHFHDFLCPDFQIWRPISRNQVIFRKNAPAKRCAPGSCASTLKVSARYRSKRAEGEVSILVGRHPYRQKEITTSNSWGFFASAPQHSIYYSIHSSTSILKYAVKWAAIVRLLVEY